MENYIRKVIDRYLSHRYPAEIDGEFRAWLAAADHAEEKDAELHRVWNEAEADSTPGFSQSLEQMRRLTGIADRRRNRRLQAHLALWRVAAALLLAVSGISVYLDASHRPDADLLQSYTPIAHLRHLTLPDGTEVMVNAQSTLIYPSAFNGETRCVYLTGEACFRVKPDPEHPFIVKSEGVQVTALGTEFNVAAYPQDEVVKATLLSGKVSVDCIGTDTPRLLSPSQQLTYHKQRHTIDLTQPNLCDVTAWQRGELVFDEMTVLQIIEVLKRKYNYDFLYSLNTLKSDCFCFRFRKDAPLSDVMEMVTDVAGYLTFRIEGDKCYIQAKN